jgi:quinoprotein dehydrogenase-associated probable ABC transporter substrate-binding protein
MSSVCRALIAAVLAAVALSASAPPAPLRVCADPNNLPFSNHDQQGFENRIAAFVAGELHRPLEYFWSPQRRGFIRNTLNARRCDLVISVPARYELLQTTRPYYRSAYAFVARRDHHLRLQSFDDARLPRLTIGIQVTGDDYANPPAAQALAVRHLAANVRGYPIYGDYSKPDPQRDIVDAVARREVDVAVVWGPLAGYYARKSSTPLEVIPIRSAPNGRASTFAFDIAMGVRRDDAPLRAALDAIIARRSPELRRILREYGVPLL